MRAGQKVMMKHLPTGKTKMVDVADVPTFRAERDSTGKPLFIVAPREATRTDVPAVQFGNPPAPDVSRVPAPVMASLGVLGSQAGIRNPQGQLGAALGGLDAAPGIAAGAADLAAPGVGRAALGAFGAGTAGEMVRQGGYNLLGQQHLLPGGGPGEMLKQALLQGGLQAASTVTGRGIGAGMRFAGRLPEDLAADAMKLPPSRAINNRSPGKAFREEKVPIGRKGSFTGTEEVEKRLSDSIAKENEIAAKHHEGMVSAGKPRMTNVGAEAGVPMADEGPESLLRVNRSEIASKAFQRLMKQRGAGRLPHEKEALDALADEFSTINLSTVTNPAKEIPQTVQDMLEIKRTYDLRATPVYEKLAKDRRGVPSDIEQQWSKAIADEARTWLVKNVPGLRTQMARSQHLVKLKQAMQNAESNFPALHSGNRSLVSQVVTRKGEGDAALKFGDALEWLGGSRRVVPASQIPRMVAGQLVPPARNDRQ